MSALPVSDDYRNLKLLIARVNELAVLPHVVFRVLEVTSSANSAAVEIERAIVVDPGFSAKLLTLANSAYYALPRKVTSIREAVMFLGFKVVRQMALTVGVFDLFVGKGDKESLRRRSWWRHSVDTAVCSRWLATHSKRLPPEEAYACGLLHCIGKTLMDRFGEANYGDVEELVAAGQTEIQAERAVFGMVHPEVSVAAAIKWGLASDLVGSLNYVTPPREDETCAANRAVVAISSAIANDAVGARSAESLPLWALEILGLPSDDISALVAMGRNAIGNAGSLSI